MANASGLRGASGSREKFFQPVSSQVIWHNICNKKIKMGHKWTAELNTHRCIMLIIMHVRCTHACANYSLDRSLSRVHKGPRANNCHGPRLALIRHCSFCSNRSALLRNWIVKIIFHPWMKSKICVHLQLWVTDTSRLKVMALLCLPGTVNDRNNNNSI